MSNQWEVVTKSKKAKNFEKKITQSEQKRLIELAGPKLEEILPSHQYKSIFAKSGKENKTPVHKVANSTVAKPATPKKTAKVQNNNNNETKKPSGQNAAPKPKNIESALLAISPDVLMSHLDLLKVSYPGSEMLWLKGITSFLSPQLHFDSDPSFSGKSYKYPSNVIPKPLKTALVEILKSVEFVNISYFYDQLLTALAVDMSKNQPTVACKLMLQLIAQNWPEVCCNNLAKTVILRNSYQNRSSIGLSLLWALGQGGYQDLNVGIKVWQNIMAPIIELKSYTKFVCEYIERILKSAEIQKLTLIQSDFFVTYNALKAKYNIPRDCQQLLSESSTLLLTKYIDSSTKHVSLFTTLFRSIDDSEKNKSEIKGCIECLNRSDECFKVWKMNYKKNVLPSYLLFQEIVSQWNDLPLKNSKGFLEFLEIANQLNNELDSSKKKDGNLENLLRVFKTIQEKSANNKKRSSGKQSSSCCKWLLASVLLIGAIGGLIAYDTHLNGAGVFEKSATGKFLKNAGVLPHVEKAWYTTMSASARGYKFAEQHVPGYYEKARVYLVPAFELLCDFVKLAKNALCNVLTSLKEFAAAKKPIVAEFVEQYVPGFPQKVENLTVSSWNALVNLYQNGRNYLSANVFVGYLSPESLSQALNQTQIAAARYYSLFHQKVDAYAKLK